MGECRYPGCFCDAVITYALVPICIEHYLKITQETAMYYEGRLDRYAERRHLLKINHMIPWRNKELKVKRWRAEPK